MRRVLAVLPEIERRSPHLSLAVRATFDVSERGASNPNASPPDLPIPSDSIRPLTERPIGWEETTSGASLVRLSKFSRPGEIRATAFYWDVTPAVVVRLLIGSQRRVSHRRSSRGREVLGAPTLMRAPRVLDHGRSGPVHHLVEPLIFGRHPRLSAEKLEVGSRVIDRLVDTWQTVGLRARRDRVHPKTPQRLRSLVASDLLGAQPVIGPEVLDLAERLTGSRRSAPTGWTHGDVVFSNLIVDFDGAVHLIDWEHAGVRPVIGDLAKIAAAMPGLTGLEAALDPGVAARLELPGPGMSVREQLTSYYLQELSWWEPKYRRARDADRLATFRAWAERRVELLGILQDQP
jgi:hypothetical protein